MSEEKRILQCLNCGQPFEPTCHITRQKFCCDACRHKYHNAKRHYDVPVDICPGCGDIVEQSGERGRRRRFCSDQCRVKYHARKVMERRQAREQTKAICPNCGKEFQAEWGTGKQRRFCSDPCRIEWWAAYHKANPSTEEPAETCAACGAPLQGRGSKKAKNIAVGFVTCWRWTRHMWKGTASGAVGQSLPPLG